MEDVEVRIERREGDVVEVGGIKFVGFIIP